MPISSLGKFEVKHLQILNEKGAVDKRLAPNLSTKHILEMYRWMVIGRVLDDKMLALQRQGRIGTFAQIRGQEASNIGAAYAIGKDDFLFPSFRENAALVARGLPPEYVLLYYGGDERGNKIPEGVNVFSTTVPVATQCLHAVGYAWGCKLKKNKRVTAVFFGDGATSEGDFHEAMNFAGVLKAPVVFVCQNNQYAISVPFEKQTAAQTIAQKAIAYGFKGIRVDGNDIFAVYKAVKEAADHARKGHGPALVECLTYRIENHTTSDDWTKYRSRNEVSAWKKKDPITRLKKYMEKKKIWNQKMESALQKEAAQIVEDGVKKFESINPQQIEEIFKYMYAEITTELKEQLTDLKDVEKNA